MLACDRTASGVSLITRMPPTNSRGINLVLRQDSAVIALMQKDTFGEGTSANVTHAYEQNSSDRLVSQFEIQRATKRYGLADCSWHMLNENEQLPVQDNEERFMRAAAFRVQAQYKKARFSD